MRFIPIICFGMALTGCSKTRSVPQLASPISATVQPDIGSARTITATFEGGSQIAEVTISVMQNRVLPGGSSKWSANKCLLRYDIATNAIWLVPDIGGTWGSHPITAGSSSTFSNSQCTVAASGSYARISGKTLTVNLDLKFTSGFSGAKQIYMASKDVNGNWSTNYQHQFGTFTLADPASSSPSSLTPTSSNQQ
jgi:hypothetical protein